MPHVVFLFYLISAATGIFTAALFYSLSLQYKNEIIKRYMHFLISINALVIIYTLLVYYRIIAAAYTSYMPLVFTVPVSMAEYLILLSYGLLLDSIFCSRQTAIVRKLTYLLSLFFMAAIIIIYHSRIKLVHDIRDGFVLVMMSGLTAYVFRKYKSIQDSRLYAGTKYFIIFFTVCIPLIAAGIALRRHEPLYSNIPQAGFFLTFYFFLWNILGIIKIRDFQNTCADKKESVPKNMKEKYHITGREQQIIELLIQGNTPRETAQVLDISYQTLRNHLYNIYQKTGTNDKLALVQLLTKPA